MRYFKLTIAYDGTDFHGWQVQTNKPTIQGEITNILGRLTQERVALYGAGRTDAGVHALGQVASFKTLSALSAQRISARFECAASSHDSNRWRPMKWDLRFMRAGRRAEKFIVTGFIAARWCRR